MNDHPRSAQGHPDDPRWQTVLARDAAAAGAFCYAVRSTGVYCRTGCPARHPRRDQVRFFDGPTEAEAAGFRPCKRCRPREVDARQVMVARVRHLIETVQPVPTLRDLGEAVGLSPTHLQRSFKQATGLSPKQYAAARRTERLKQALKDGGRVMDALYDAGYGSARALYETANGTLGMTPGAYQRGGDRQRIAYDVVDSPLGQMLVATTAAGVCALAFGDHDALLRGLREEFPRATLHPDPAAVAPYVRAALDHLAGRRPTFDVPLDVAGTAFQQRVWGALWAIPPGETRTYREVAEVIGAPAAVRAVARACAANRVALAVPCHRVGRQDGGLGGYRWGIARKAALREREARLAAFDTGIEPVRASETADGRSMGGSRSSR